MRRWAAQIRTAHRFLGEEFACLDRRGKRTQPIAIRRVYVETFNCDDGTGDAHEPHEDFHFPLPPLPALISLTR
jgi:hypothetical protein